MAAVLHHVITSDIFGWHIFIWLLLSVNQAWDSRQDSQINRGSVQ